MEPFERAPEAGARSFVTPGHGPGLHSARPARQCAGFSAKRAALSAWIGTGPVILSPDCPGSGIIAVVVHAAIIAIRGPLPGVGAFPR